MVAKIKPFLKWAGGKRKLVPFLTDLLPPTINTYYEPFVGAGAFYWELIGTDKINNAVISDVIKNLTDTYQILKYNIDELIIILKSFEKEYKNNPKELFLKERLSSPKKIVEQVARFVFLNRTCFNGLYRVNKKGKFNVPWGKYINPAIVQEDLLRRCSELIHNTTVLNLDFEIVVSMAKPGDVVYFDPPYIPLNKSSFTKYTAGGFDAVEHMRLAKCFDVLAERGVFVLASNSDTELTRDLYKQHIIHEVKMARNINSKSDRRHKISELVIVGDAQSNL